MGVHRLKLQWSDWDEEPWEQDANCRGSDPNIFFSARGKQHTQSREVCAECRVAPQCKEFAVRTNQVFGYWASTADERIAIRRARRLPIDPGFTGVDP